MSASRTLKHGERSSENIKSFFSAPNLGMAPTRKTLQVLQPSVVNRNMGRVIQEGKAIPKRKQWHAEQAKGSKRAKAEVKSTQTETAYLPDGISTTEAYELMVKETPPSTYWKEVADERRMALFNVLQENERLHKDIEAKDEEITHLKTENEELQELAQHVQHMADMIERLTGKSPDNLEAMREIALDVEEEEEDSEDGNETLEDYGEFDFSDSEDGAAPDHVAKTPGEED
ncbi:geminin [Aplochiton taeniatus]